MDNVTKKYIIEEGGFNYDNNLKKEVSLSFLLRGMMLYYFLIVGRN